MTDTVNDQPIADEAESRAEAKRKAYSAATTRFRKENPSEWNRVLKDEYAKVGIEWNPKPTEEERAAAEIERLLAEHPDLRTKFTHGH
jgi:hypothetical protein